MTIMIFSNLDSDKVGLNVFHSRNLAKKGIFLIIRRRLGRWLLYYL